MCYGNTFIHLGTLELKDILRFAASDAHLIGPGADASLGIKYQANGTGDHVKLAIDTEIELIADAWLLVTKITILPGAMLRRLWSFFKTETITMLN